MSRTQMRANSGASAAAREGETVGETNGVPAAAKTQTTVAGTGDKIWFCEAAGAVASTGTAGAAGAALQQAILPWQPQSCAAGLAAGADATAAWLQRSSRLQRMVSAIFTVWLSPVRRVCAGRILP